KQEPPRGLFCSTISSLQPDTTANDSATAPPSTNPNLPNAGGREWVDDSAGCMGLGLRMGSTSISWWCRCGKPPVPGHQTGNLSLAMRPRSTIVVDSPPQFGVWARL